MPPFLLSLLASPRMMRLAGLVALGLLVFGAWKWAEWRIGSLEQQLAVARQEAEAQRKVNEEIRADIARVQQRQQELDQTLVAVRSNAAKQARAIAAAPLRGNAAEIQAQVNSQTKDLFQGLVQVSRGPAPPPR